MFGGMRGDLSGTGANKHVMPSTVKPWYTGPERTKTITNPETGETSTVSLGGYTPSQCNSVTEDTGIGGPKGCCAAYKGYWYQDYGIFAPMFPDKSFDYCHEKPMGALQVPLNQELLIGGTVAGVAALVAVLMWKKMRR